MPGYAEDRPPRCIHCGAAFGPNRVVVGWRPATNEHPAGRIYTCRACNGVTPWIPTLTWTP